MFHSLHLASRPQRRSISALLRAINTYSYSSAPTGRGRKVGFGTELDRASLQRACHRPRLCWRRIRLGPAGRKPPIPRDRYHLPRAQGDIFRCALFPGGAGGRWHGSQGLPTSVVWFASVARSRPRRRRPSGIARHLPAIILSLQHCRAT